MKTLKKLSSVFLICLAVLTTQTVFAQKEEGRRGHRPTPEQRLEHMTTELNLSDEQQSQIKSILETTKSEMQAVKNNDELEDKRAAVRQIIENQEKKINEVLTEEQRTKAQKLHKERRARMDERRNTRQHRGKRPTIEERLERMSTELSLTDDQKSKIKTILEDGQTRMEQIKENDDEPEQKKMAVREVMENQKTLIKAVLTDEQKAKAQAMRQERQDNIQEKKDAFKTMKEELEQYRAENIQPVMQEQRKKLEKHLSDADKKELAEIRAKLKENKMAFKKFDFDNRYHMISAAGLKGSLREEHKKLRETRKAEMDKAKAIEKRYTTQIQALQDEIQPQAEQWKSDMRAIKEKHIPKDQNHNHDAQKRPTHGKHQILKDENFDMDDYKRVRFLLQEPNGEEKIETDGTLKVFPNPANGQVTVEFTITSSGNVSLELRNYLGRGGRTIFHEKYYEAGTYQEIVNLEGLNSSSYIIGLSTPNGNLVTEKLVIQQ